MPALLIQDNHISALILSTGWLVPGFHLVPFMRLLFIQGQRSALAPGAKAADPFLGGQKAVGGVFSKQ
jgi:hypothetical protein